MRILGIDPGLSRTGYGCVDLSDGAIEPTLVEAGVVRLRASRSLADRLKELFDELTAIVEEVRPDLMVVETLFTHMRYARTGILMGHARGVVLLVGAAGGVALDELAPAQIKRAVTGSGAATKEQVQRAVQAQLRLDALPEPSDVADALAIALCAARREASVVVG